MASPINTFKTYTATLTTNNDVIYTTPSNSDTIGLMCQISNVTNTTANITASHYDGSSVTTELVKNFAIPGADAVTPLTGKLVLENGQSFIASCSANSTCKITLSVLETV